jgi:hypothetical protein
MFTLDDLRTLLNAKPFVPFRLHLSDSGHIDIRHRELVFPGRRFAVIGLVDPEATDTVFDRYMTVWYMHVTRAEQLTAGSAPSFPSPPPTPPESSSDVTG